MLAETVVEIDYEVTLLTVRTGDRRRSCTSASRSGIDRSTGLRPSDTVLESWQPQQMIRPRVDAAKSIAARIVNALGGRGVFGVELLVRGDEVYFSDVTARPHDSGLVTLRSQRLSQFDLHARATLGLPVDTIMISPAAAEVVYGGGRRPVTSARRVGRRRWPRRCGVPESDVRVFAPAAPARRGAPARAGAGHRPGRDGRAGPGAADVGAALRNCGGRERVDATPTTDRRRIDPACAVPRARW